jgi:putative nucleotidyltransferase with HDIG domain
MQRVKDANSHVAKVNRLYMSTIETLAMAIDAKDQITHGHIRRVQLLAVELARKLGVSDPSLLQAIEAAALLHDTGKLAVPEHILNKPGKLTAAEFEKMKLHVTVGADILSAIDFPYPVVPIVRSHHENWDGTGYPTGLKGTEIPIGARILSVVDCFDALISDRPYRARLSDDDALAILFQRRGSMYDPLIVDTFARVYRDIAQDLPPIENTKRALEEITSSTSQRPPLNGMNGGNRTSVDRLLLFLESTQVTTGETTVQKLCATIDTHLTKLIHPSIWIFFAYNGSSDELEARFVSHATWAHLAGCRIKVGERLSGWVAAHRQTIVNSDPRLDIGDISNSVAPPLSSSMSTPLLAGEELIGVLTLYSDQSFSDHDRRLLELLAIPIAKSLKRSRAEDSVDAPRLAFSAGG